MKFSDTKSHVKGLRRVCILSLLSQILATILCINAFAAIKKLLNIKVSGKSERKIKKNKSWGREKSKIYLSILMEC